MDLKKYRRPLLFWVFPSLVSAVLGFSLQKPRVEAASSLVRSVDEHVFYRDLPFTGFLVERNLRNDLLSLVQYREGEKDGVGWRYHHDGKLVAESRYVRGKKHGQQLTWYIDGRLKSVSYFRMGLSHGTYTEWHPSGRLYRVMKTEDGVEVTNQRYFESGAPYSNIVRRNGRTYGMEGEPLCRAEKDEGLK
jgi:antitoxin component YwqK of YwqJK toxin-antitoxin module